MTIARLLKHPHAGARSSGGRPADKTTPGALDTQGAQPPGTPALDRQRLFPDVRPTIAQEPAQDNAILVALVRHVLPAYNDEEARACITDPHAVLDLQRARDSWWLMQIEFEEVLLCLFVKPSAPSPAGCKSGGLGAQDATAYDRGRECLPAPSCNIDTQDNISEVIATIVSNCNTPFVKMLQSMPARRR